MTDLHLVFTGSAGRRIRFDRPRLRRVLTAALAESAHAHQACALSVLLVGDAESQRLHAEHFHDATPTDVMTFPDGSEDLASGRLLLGDLAVGVDVARREAERRDRAAGDELTLYILHGLLHLIGYDDVTPAKRRRMWAAQRRLLAAEGIAIENQPC